MASNFRSTDLGVLLHEADAGARRLARRLGFPSHQIEDVRQDLLVDLIRRLPAFDSQRGVLGAFAGIVVSHRAARIAVAVRRERVLFGFAPVSVDEELSDGSGLTRGDLIAEEDGYGALFGQATDRIADSERRLVLTRGLAILSDLDARLCASLADAEVDDLVASGAGARSSLYRQLKAIRLDLMAAGVPGA